MRVNAVQYAFEHALIAWNANLHLHRLLNDLLEHLLVLCSSRPQAKETGFPNLENGLGYKGNEKQTLQNSLSNGVQVPVKYLVLVVLDLLQDLANLQGSINELALSLCKGDKLLEDLKRLCKLGSRTPGHPENYSADSIEVTTDIA
ncbi:hypothetical protein POTOM_029232 [Populus tomentosa]|uniref:Transketolase N-terminal domain-containing protein n=1 Tax=Populus tomentosa TaxID=118781 RepID=A0A8X7Z6J5_POPTO|nr:hypothetical protein POTOM_029232 [Populus tomentosa]